jgi:hypothetical protein
MSGSFQLQQRAYKLTKANGRQTSTKRMNLNFSTYVRVRLCDSLLTRIDTKIDVKVHQALQYAHESMLDGRQFRRNLNPVALRLLQQWWEDNAATNIYPSEEEKRRMAFDGGINLAQVNNW